MHPMYRGGYRPGMYGMPPGAGMQMQGGQQQQQSQQPQQHYVDVALHTPKEHKMSEERVEVKNIFQGGERGGYGGGGSGLDGGLATAAAIAALGGRNERGFGGGFCGPVGFGGFGDGFGGGGLIAALALAGLVGGRGFGRDHGHGHDGDRLGPVILNNAPRDRDRDNDCCDQLGQQVILSKLGSIEGAIPLAAASTTNAILSQTNELQGTLATLALGVQQGFSNVKDSVQAASGAELLAIGGVKDAVMNGFALTNTNLLQGLCSVKETVVTDGDRTRALLVARFQQEDATKIAAQAAEIIELRNDRDSRSRHADLELKITNTNTAIAAQQQAQGQFQVQKLGDDVARLHHLVSGVLQVAQASANQTSIIAGNLGAVVGGAQNATQTPINNRA